MGYHPADQLDYEGEVGTVAVRLKRIDLAVAVSAVLLACCFWQLEVIYIVASNPQLGWGYSFGGLGDFGLQLYTWRDIWYFLICVCWALLFCWREKR